MSEKAIRYPRRKLIRTILRAGIAAVLGTIADVKINGRENLPKSGPLLIIGNHFHFLDPVAMILAMPYPIEFIGGLRTPNAPGWTETFRQAWGVLHVRRGTSSRDSLLAATDVLKLGGALAIFPEGGSWATVLRPPRPGAALLAARSNAPILPVGFNGLIDVFPALSKRKRARVEINIGKPFGPFQFSGKEKSMREQMDDFGHDMMRHLRDLIPAAQHGYYSDDPAVREAARGTEIYPWEGMIEE